MTLRTKLLVGHVLEQLATLPDTSIHCCVTSPPYWGLRDYGTEPQIWGVDPTCEHVWTSAGSSSQRQRNGADGEIHDGRTTNKLSENITINPSQGSFCHCGAWRGSLGLEPTPQLYVEHLVAIFREVRRVLRDDGTLWLNIGDSYAGHNPIGWRAGNEAKNQGNSNKNGVGFVDGCKPKDLVGIPWMLAFALRADGWYLRSEIVWAKTAPMPESVTDRPTNAHEKIFLFSKNERYFYDQEAVKEKAITVGDERHLRTDKRKEVDPFCIDERSRARTVQPQGEFRNQRNVWTLNPSPFAGAHFATFPQEIPRRAILAGTSEKGVCPKCEAPYTRIIDKISKAKKRGSNPSDFRALGMPQQSGVGTTTTTLGWQPSCKCDAGDPIPATVLDPFFGSGTTGVVAQQLWRLCIGIDLSDKYAQIDKERMPDGLLYSLETPDAL
jgi:DNA modification methylase